MGRKRDVVDLDIGRARLASLTVGSESLLIRFFRVPPGRENGTALKLSRGAPDGVVCRVFGSHDFAVVEKSPNWDGFTPLGERPFHFEALDVLPVRCFAWQESFDWNTFKRDSNELVGFSFVKISEELVRQKGVQAEAEIIRRISSVDRPPGVSIHVVGTMAWHELLILVTGSSMKDIQGFILEVRSITNGTTGESLIDSTVTVMAARSLPSVSPDAVLDEMEIYLQLACLPGTDQAVLRAVRQKATFAGSEVIWSFGINDFVVKLPQVDTVLDYLTRLWRLRRDQQHNLLRTTTLFGGAIASEGVDDDAAERYTPVGLPFKVPGRNRPRVRELKSINSSLAAQLTDTFGALSNYSTDRQAGIEFRELWPFASKLRDDVVTRPRGTSWQGDPVQNEDYLQVQLELLMYGIHQRELGTTPFWEREGPIYPHVSPFGATHRYLSALASIPASLVPPNLPDDIGWDGFCIIGYHKEFFRYSGGVINVPWQALDDIGWLLTLVHEVGHEQAVRVNVVGHDELKGTLEAAGFYGEDGVDLTLEVFAEAYACQRIFGTRDWPSFFSQSWQHLKSSSPAREPLVMLGLFQRFLLTNLLVDYELRGRIANRQTVERIGKAMAAQIQSICAGSWKPSIRVVDDAIEQCWRLADEGLLQILAVELAEERSHTPSRRDGRLRDALKEGKIPIGYQPLSVLKALSSLGQDWRASVATVIALWHWRKITLSRSQNAAREALWSG